MLALSVSACATTTETITTQTAQSAFRTPVDGKTDAGFVVGPLTRSFSNHNAEGDGYANTIGPLIEGGFGAAAGILPTTTVLAQPDSGSISYDANFIVRALVGIGETDGQVHAFSVGQNGQIELTADFGANTLTGSADQFSVDGVLDENGTGMSGTVRWTDQTGALIGQVGSDEVIGAFQGHSDTTVFTGGFIGTAQPTP
ncbi:hypothetical protein [Yoonia sp. SS1-5]|uniref:Transferrin-binding protein B C-lobe/N-lobe beta barrel domain-containing protein n=1 Tax=Yoonia rhodophyticola TaxID=3137370 RepID=A0AAN0NL48_9RHOB